MRELLGVVAITATLYSQGLYLNGYCTDSSEECSAAGERCISPCLSRSFFSQPICQTLSGDDEPCGPPAEHAIWLNKRAQIFEGVSSLVAALAVLVCLRKRFVKSVPPSQRDLHQIEKELASARSDLNAAHARIQSQNCLLAETKSKLNRSRMGMAVERIRRNLVERRLADAQQAFLDEHRRRHYVANSYFYMSAECCVCFETYTSEDGVGERQRRHFPCGHDVCAECAQKVQLIHRCPSCRRDGSPVSIRDLCM